MFIDHILNGLVFIAGLCLAFIVVSVCTDVIGRAVFNLPIQWVCEIAEYLLLVITFFAAAWCLREEGHVEMDIVTIQLPTKVQYFMKVLTSVMGVCLCGVLCYYSALVSWDLYRRGLYYPTLLEVPKAPVIAVLFLGFFLLCIQFTRRIHHYFILWKDFNPEEQATLPDKAGSGAELGLPDSSRTQDGPFPMDKDS